MKVKKQRWCQNFFAHPTHDDSHICGGLCHSKITKKEREIDDGVFFSGKKEEEKEKEKHVFVALSSNFSIHSWIFPTYDKRGGKGQKVSSPLLTCAIAKNLPGLHVLCLSYAQPIPPSFIRPFAKRRRVGNWGAARGSKREKKRKYASSLLFFCRETAVSARTRERAKKRRRS